MTNPKLTELASLLDGAFKDDEVEKAAMVILGEVDERLDAVTKLISRLGCQGICAHGACIIEKSCEECHMMDEDDWCVCCLVSQALFADTEQSNAR